MVSAFGRLNLGKCCPCFAVILNPLYDYCLFQDRDSRYFGGYIAADKCEQSLGGQLLRVEF